MKTQFIKNKLTYQVRLVLLVLLTLTGGCGVTDSLNSNQALLESEMNKNIIGDEAEGATEEAAVEEAALEETSSAEESSGEKESVVTVAALPNFVGIKSRSYIKWDDNILPSDKKFEVGITYENIGTPASIVSGSSLYDSPINSLTLNVLKNGNYRLVSMLNMPATQNIDGTYSHTLPMYTVPYSNYLNGFNVTVDLNSLYSPSRLVESDYSDNAVILSFPGTVNLAAAVLSGQCTQSGTVYICYTP